jgi:N-dimethylarginine dimethylaminohydrolase
LIVFIPGIVFLISKAGLILCNMGRSSRTPEAVENYAALSDKGYKIAGQIQAPGTLEGGDFYMD